jgi:hypothetical protein
MILTHYQVTLKPGTIMLTAIIQLRPTPILDLQETIQQQ